MSRTITVTIGNDGTVKVATEGFEGTDCLKATAGLEAALGKTTRDVATREQFDIATTEHRGTVER